MSDEIKKKKVPVDPVIFEPGAELAPEPQNQPKKGIRPAIFEAPIKSFEDKTYIVLVKLFNDDDLFDGSFKVCHGRTECYTHIEDVLESYADSVDIHNSLIITETRQTETETGDIKYYLLNLPECVSLYAFCKSVETYYGTYGFNIEDYNKGNNPKEDAESSSLIPNSPEDEEMYGTFREFLALRDSNNKELFSETVIGNSFIEIPTGRNYDFDDGNGINV